ncbi:MAG: hypothetical protein ACLTDM_07365 [Clostridium butyricum]
MSKLDKCNIKIRALTDNKEILNRCRTTVWKEGLDKEPTILFMEDIYKAEHSPIRDKWFSIEIKNIPYWLSTHFVRHSIGYTPYVSTQRDDRISYEGDRDDRRQGELVNMDITLNAQSFINVSKVRLCGQAHPLAQLLWKKVLEVLKTLDEPLANNCVPTCIYRGFCPEKYPCGRLSEGSKTLEFYKEWRKSYIGNRPKL